jgi:hypothetical protein
MHRWTVEGADKVTGLETVRSISALTEEEASAAASKGGMLVSAVYRSSLDIDEQNEAEKLGRQKSAPPDYSKTLQDISGYVRTIRAWISFMGVLVLLAVLAEILRIITDLIQAHR